MMKFRRRSLLILLALYGSVFALGRVAQGAEVPEIPPVTAEERALAAVPGEPNAPAVVLFRKGELLMMGYGYLGGSLKSHLRVQTRVKVLTEHGLSNGEITIAHSGYARLEGFSGRTVLPDGRVIPVPADAKFKRRTSRSKGIFVTAMAFPAVQVGAILDYQYELVLDSPYYFEPWYFSDEELPVRRSEIVYKTPADWRMQLWSRSPLGVPIQREGENGLKGNTVRFWAEDLPSLPREPQGPPFEDLAAQALLLPTARVNAFHPLRLLESWYSTTYLFDQVYALVRGRDAGVAKKAREIAASGTPRQKAEALYRFVRDEIETEPAAGVGVEPDASLARILSERRGTGTEKALLLEKMLKEVHINGALVWAADRNRGVIDPHLANPHWFDAVFVMVRLDGERLFLDPADRALALGAIPAEYEGTPALVPIPSNPLGLVLPSIPFDQNLRQAEVELSLDAGGRLSGSGELLLTGHPAAEKMGEPAEARTAEAWRQWLASRYRDFRIADVRTVEAPDERRVTVTWRLDQRPEEVLGDEVSLATSAPLGPLTQPFVQTASERQTSVALDYPYREETVLHLCWRAGWRIEGRPSEAMIASGAGMLAVHTELEEGGHRLVFSRRLDLPQNAFDVPEEYASLRSLFGELEKSDAQPILLVRR
jgi:hypothetical protein